jgi:hypothetical protein
MLTKKQKNTIIKTMLPFNPKKIGIFGSVARDEDSDRSDIDILYSFNNRYSLFDIAGLQIELENLLNKKIDLVEFSAIHPKLKEKILNESIIFYGK